ncbi:MAG: NAD(P)-binding protein [Candidatus Aminicenantes bacterium]|nr:NAD(P)-binding protein [Candidatus Aminicenantes bacterium]
MLQLKNQFIFAPIKTGYSDGTGGVTERHLAFYKRRAQYLGAVIAEPFYMDKGLRELPTQMGIDKDDKIEGLQKLVATIHESGTKVIAHFNHPGRMANPKIPGNYFLSSTDSPCENGGSTPRRMEKEDMKKVVELFVEAAVRAEKANFDVIELQFGHGYLLAQFISPFVNDRTDEFGGSFENRIRFPLKVLHAVMDAVDLPIIVRISGDEMIPEGIKLPEMTALSKILEKKGAKAIHVSAGTVCSTAPWFFQHMFVPKGKTWEMAKKIKEEINIPVIFVGRINSLEDIEKVRKEYSADYMAVGRALVADPDFVGKYFGEMKGTVKPCLACAEGCLGGVKSGQGLQCLVNPEAGRETETIKPARQSKKYAVVGGGLAGMQAAITLRIRGHEVDLYEKNTLGGQFNLAPLTPNKRSMAKLIPYFKEELKDNKANVIFKEAKKSDLTSKYDGVILATGSKPAVPPIPGLDKFYWADILLEENLPENKKVLIIGGGLIGVDIATALIARSNKVIIVKRTTDFGEDMEAIAKTLSLKMMKEKGTVFSDHTHIKRVEGRTVYAERSAKNIRFDDVDVIVVSTSMKSYNPLEKELEDKMPVYVIGDAKEVGNAQDAIRDAYETAREN